MQMNGQVLTLTVIYVKVHFLLLINHSFLVLTRTRTFDRNILFFWSLSK